MYTNRWYKGYYLTANGTIATSQMVSENVYVNEEGRKSEDSIPQGARIHANHDSTEKVRKSYKAKNFYKGDLENEKVEKITSSCNVCIYAADTSNCKCRGSWQQ